MLPLELTGADQKILCINPILKGINKHDDIVSLGWQDGNEDGVDIKFVLTVQRAISTLLNELCF